MKYATGGRRDPRCPQRRALRDQRLALALLGGNERGVVLGRGRVIATPARQLLVQSLERALDLVATEARRLGAPAVTQRVRIAAAQNNVDASDPLQLVGRREQERRRAVVTGGLAIAACDPFGAGQAGADLPAQDHQIDGRRARHPARQGLVDRGKQHHHLGPLLAQAIRVAARGACDVFRRRAQLIGQRRVGDAQQPDLHGAGARAHGLDRRRANRAARREVRGQALRTHQRGAAAKIGLGEPGAGQPQLLELRRQEGAARVVGGAFARRRRTLGIEQAAGVNDQHRSRCCFSVLSFAPFRLFLRRAHHAGEPRDVAQRIAGAAARLHRSMHLGGVDDRQPALGRGCGPVPPPPPPGAGRHRPRA